MTNTELTLEAVFKTKAGFEDYMVNNPMPVEICEVMSGYPQKPITRIAELTQSIDTLLNKVGDETFNPNQYLVWITVNPKDKIVNTIKTLNGNGGLGIFIFKTSLNDNETTFECLLKPQLKEKAKRTVNTETPAKQLQQSIWEKYIEICDASEYPDMQIKEALPRHYQPISIQIAGVQILQTLNTQKGYVASELAINNDKEIFNRLLEHKAEIEEELGGLEWDSKENNKSAKIRKTYYIDINNSENHEQAINELIKMGADLKTIAHKYL